MGFAVSRHNSDLCSVPPFLDDFQQLAIILAKTVRRIVNIEIKYQTIHATRTMRTDTQEHGSLIIVNVLQIQGKIREF